MYNIFSNICLVLFIILVLIVIYKYIKKKEIKDNNKILGFIDKHYKIIFVIILIIFLFTRLYNLSILPYRIHMDEASLAYNAYCIANYGVDRYQNIYPLYFLNFDNGQSAMYTYAVALLIKVFGYSLTAVRVPAVLGGLLALVMGYFIGKEVKDKSFGLLVSTLFAICPYFIMNSRWAIDCDLMLGFFSLSIYLLLKAIKSGKNYMYLISGILFGITLYTYALSYMIMPVVLLLILIYLIYLKKITLKQVLMFAIPFVIFFIPVILDLLIEFGMIDEIKTRFFSIPKMGNDRASEISIKAIFDNLTSFSYFTNKSFPTEYFEYGTMYIFSIPFAILGFVYTIYQAIANRREFNIYMYILLITIGGFTALLFALSGYSRVHMGNAMFMYLVIYLALGLSITFKYIKYSIIIIPCIYLIAFTSFNYYYFTEFAQVEYENADMPMRDYMAAIEDAYSRDKKIFMDLYVIDTRWATLYVGLATKMSPYFYSEAEDHMGGSISFYVPLDYDKDNVYILISRSHYDDFIQHGFTCNKYGSVYEYYYKEE